MITLSGRSSPGTIAYFGDSLTDNTNFFDLARLMADPSALLPWVGPTGSASDGPTHVSYTANLLGAVEQNFAVIAAEVNGVQKMRQVFDTFNLSESLVIPDDSPLLDFDINLRGQVDRFFETNAGRDLSDTAAIFMIGVNDYNEVNLNSEHVFRDLLIIMGGVIAGITADAVRMAEAGVGRIVITPLPSSKMFAGGGLVEEALLSVVDALFELHNRALQTAVDAMIDAGLPVEMLDFTVITNALIDDLTAFGFIAPKATTVIDLDENSPYDPDQVFANDVVHPSTAGQAVLGAFNAFALSGGTATQLNDWIDIHVGGETDDFVAGLGGPDTLLGLGGNDILIGGTGYDRLLGDTGDDILSGGTGGDVLRGGFGDDILAGGEGDDRILGGFGNDLLIDGLGSDIVQGGAGRDTFIYTEASLIGGTPGDQDSFDGGFRRDELILVLSSETYDSLARDLESRDPTDALATLGITIESIEKITVVEGRDGLEQFSSESWYVDADVWGLI